MSAARLDILIIAVACSGSVAVVGLLIARYSRFWSVRAALFAVALVGVLSVLAGVIVTSEAMFISGHDLSVVLSVSLTAGIVALGVALVLARQVIRDVEAVRATARALSSPRRGADRPLPRTSELAEIDEELDLAGRRLAEARRREQALEASRRELVAWVSHDLRTPLAGLRAMAEALEDGVAGDPARYHGQIRREVDRLSRLVDDLFELSRIQSGALTLTLQQVDLGELVSDVVAGSQAMAEAGRVRLGAQAQPARVTADAGGLGRALTNLVVNAIRHTPADGSVQIGCAPDGAEIVLIVSDGCGGLSDEALERMFEPGWRENAARTPEPDGGAGLGLAIARGIVEAHEGRICVQNMRGGCRIEVRLPRAQPAGTEPEVAVGA